MNLNLGHFKKIKEDEHAAVLQHPEGHHIVLSKSMMSPKMRGQLAALPTHLADGGDVPEENPRSVMAKSEGQGEERGRANDPNFQPQFPEAQQGGQQQAPVVINVGQPQQQPQSQPPPPPQNNPPRDVYGNFDMNKFAMQNPEASPQTKMNAMKGLAVDEQIKNQMAESNAADKQMAEQKAYTQAIQYNQMAAKLGYPPIAVPSAPQPALAQASAEAPGQAPMPQGAPQAPNMPGQVPSDPYGLQAYQDYFQKGVGAQTGGIEKQAEAEGTVGKAQADILGEQIKSQRAQEQSYQDHYATLDSERQAFQKDIQNAHIDPQHYLSSLGTGQKISTGIGLILGGMGGGLTGQGNAALDFLNKQIDRDISAQKEDLGKKENLLTANMRQFGNLRDATEMTKVMQMDIVKNQLAQAAASAQSPLAQARAQQAIGQLDQQIAPIMSQIAMRKSLSGGPSIGAQQDPATQIRVQSMMGIIPKEQVEPMMKELKEAEEQVKGRDAALAAFDQMNQVNTIGNRIGSPIQTPKQTDALRNNLAVQLARAAAGRVNEYEFEAAKQLFPAVGDDAKTIQLKKQQLTNFIQEKMGHPALEAYGIHLGSVKPGNRYGESGQKKIQLGAPVLSQR